MQTNKTIEIFSKGKDWQGNLNPSSKGTFDVYLEEHSTRARGNEPPGIISETKGFFMLDTYVDLEQKLIEYDSRKYEVAEWDVYYKRDGNFHHLEADFK